MKKSKKQMCTSEINCLVRVHLPFRDGCAKKSLREKKLSSVLGTFAEINLTNVQTFSANTRNNRRKKKILLHNIIQDSDCFRSFGSGFGYFYSDLVNEKAWNEHRKYFRFKKESHNNCLFFNFDLDPVMFFLFLTVFS